MFCAIALRTSASAVYWARCRASRSTAASSAAACSLLRCKPPRRAEYPCASTGARERRGDGDAQREDEPDCRWEEHHNLGRARRRAEHWQASEARAAAGLALGQAHGGEEAPEGIEFQDLRTPGFQPGAAAAPGRLARIPGGPRLRREPTKWDWPRRVFLQQMRALTIMMQRCGAISTRDSMLSLVG